MTASASAPTTLAKKGSPSANVVALKIVAMEGKSVPRRMARAIPHRRRVMRLKLPSRESSNPWTRLSCRFRLLIQSKPKDPTRVNANIASR